MGSKNRISGGILPIILKDRKEGQYYVEPFCGGLGTMDKVTGNRIASDKNKYLIAMWRGLQADEPRSMKISKDLYSMARTEFNNGTNIEFTNFEIGWIGFMGSFNGRFFDGGYSGKTLTRDYVDEQIRNTMKQADKLDGINFTSESYDDLLIPPNSIIYCDPPYENTKKYSTSKDFSHPHFWQWCRDMSNDGHEVFISEYNAPDDFECVWETELKSFMKPSRAEVKTEKLFKYNGKIKL